MTTELASPLRRTGRVTGSGRTRDSRTRNRRDVLLLLGPCALYLIAFSIFPLGYSLAISFMEYDSKTADFSWIGVGNYQELFTDEVFLEAVENTVIFTFGGVALQVVLGVALALFFNQRLRGAGFVPRHPHPADADHAHRRRPYVEGAPQP